MLRRRGASGVVADVPMAIRADRPTNREMDVVYAAIEAAFSYVKRPAIWGENVFGFEGDRLGKYFGETPIENIFGDGLRSSGIAGDLLCLSDDALLYLLPRLFWIALFEELAIGDANGCVGGFLQGRLSSWYPANASAEQKKALSDAIELFALYENLESGSWPDIYLEDWCAPLKGSATVLKSG
jgi:hypothetical protein